jgi:hypothetical protein
MRSNERDPDEVSLARQGTIRVLDAEFVVKDSVGNTRKAEASELGGSE